jgi:hypothetical protein
LGEFEGDNFCLRVCVISACAIAQDAESKIFFSLIEKRKWARVKFKKVEKNFVEA